MDKPTTLVQGRSAAVHIPPPTVGGEEAAMRRLMLFLTNEFARHPSGDARLDPYQMARTILGGYPEFRRACVRRMQELARWDPWVTGRINAPRFAKPVWFALKIRLANWCHRVNPGIKMTPRMVAEVYEAHFVEKTGKKSMREERWKITTPSVERHGADGWGPGWKSSGEVREGNYHEIMQDLDVDEAAKTEMHNEYDAVAEDVDEHGRA